MRWFLNGNESRHDIIQAVTFGKPEGVIAFCKGIQAAAPVDSYVTPEPWAMPGYDSDVIMAAGAFVQGSSIELSADGPIKPPYAVLFPGRSDLASCKAWYSDVSAETGGGRCCNTSGIRKTGGKRMEVCVIGAGSGRSYGRRICGKERSGSDGPGSQWINREKRSAFTGNGRCNLTNRGIQNAAPYFSDAPETADGILRGFPAEDTVHFYESLGLSHERAGRRPDLSVFRSGAVCSKRTAPGNQTAEDQTEMPGTGGFR